LSRLLMFDAKMTVRQLQAETRLRRKKPYRRNKSRLDRYRMEILALRQHGASAAEIQRWLRQKRVCVFLTTVTRWLEKNDGQILSRKN
ncbi:MAG: hypothetical protein E6294_08390, partial [Klebsiella sp.]|nr:hypothetical protein [Klebsiella sp.]